MIYPGAQAKNKSSASGYNITTGIEEQSREHFTGLAWLNVPAPGQMRSKCLDVHLNPYKQDLLEGRFMENFDIYTKVKEFFCLFQCCFCQYFGTDEFDNNHQWPIKDVKLVSFGLLL